MIKKKELKVISRRRKVEKKEYQQQVSKMTRKLVVEAVALFSEADEPKFDNLIYDIIWQFSKTNIHK